MSVHTATIEWTRGAAPFVDRKYSRTHVWKFDGGVQINASSSPQVVPEPLSDATAVDPEEAYVAALSSCHMLWLLSIAAAEGYCVDAYRDQAIGRMSRNERGELWISHVELQPHIEFSGPKQPDTATLARLHHQAHANCFIANSVRTKITVHGLG